MTERGMKYPTVFTVDPYENRPPVPPRPSKRRQVGLTQVLLFLMVSVALCGMVVEAWLIYRLYNPQSSTTDTARPSSSKRIGNEPDPETTPTEWPRLEDPPSKPTAQLTDGQDITHENEIMHWSKLAEPLLYKIDYKDGCLVIQEKGYYYVYSKVSFYNMKSFHHSIRVRTKKYYGGSISLLKARQYSNKALKLTNSFLAGVFHFNKDDAIFVSVSNTSKIVRHEANENIFGVYMI